MKTLIGKEAGKELGRGKLLQNQLKRYKTNFNISLLNLNYVQVKNLSYINTKDCKNGSCSSTVMRQTLNAAGMHWPENKCSSYLVNVKWFSLKKEVTIQWTDFPVFWGVLAVNCIQEP